MAKKDKPKRAPSGAAPDAAPESLSKKQRRTEAAAALDARVAALEARLDALTRVFDEALRPKPSASAKPPAPPKPRRRAAPPASTDGVA